MRHENWCDRVNSVKQCNCGLTGAASSEPPKSTLAQIETTKNADAIAMCEAVLERLRSGESVAFGFVEVARGRTVGTGWSASEVYHLLNSGAARLAHRLASQAE